MSLLNSDGDVHAFASTRPIMVHGARLSDEAVWLMRPETGNRRGEARIVCREGRWKGDLTSHQRHWVVFEGRELVVRNSVRLVVADLRGLEGLSAVPDEAFHLSLMLERVLLPPGIARFGQSSFRRCPRLRAIEGVSQAVALEAYSLHNTAALEEIAWSRRVGSIGNAALSGCGVHSLDLRPASGGVIDAGEARRLRRLRIGRGWRGTLQLGGCVGLQELWCDDCCGAFGVSMDAVDLLRVRYFSSVGRGFNGLYVAMEYADVVSELASLSRRASRPALPA